MEFCNNCGAQITEDKKFCASCGQPVTAASASYSPPPYQQPAAAASASYSPPQYQQQPLQQDTDSFDPADIEKNKTMAGLAYFIFFLPLIACKDSRFARFHANQGLLLFLLSIVGSIVLSIIPIIGWILLFIFPILIVVLGIMGLLNGLNGRAKELPLIGKLRLIK